MYFSIKSIIYAGLSISSLFLLTNCDSGSDSNTISNPTTNETPTQGSESEQLLTTEVHNKINAYRLSQGLPELNLDTQISEFAREHNQYMSNQTHLLDNGQTHLSHDNFTHRAALVTNLGYNKIGENVATNKGFSVAEISDVLVNGWIESQGHRENIEGDFTHTGLDVYIDPVDSTVYATQIFAREE